MIMGKNLNIFKSIFKYYNIVMKYVQVHPMPIEDRKWHIPAQRDIWGSAQQENFNYTGKENCNVKKLLFIFHFDLFEL